MRIFIIKVFALISRVNLDTSRNQHMATLKNTLCMENVPKYKLVLLSMNGIPVADLKNCFALFKTMSSLCCKIYGDGRFRV
jgi:hypothetical protein